jgi:hypothetical protein
MDRAAAEEEARLKFERERAIKNFHLEQEQKKKAEKRKHRKEKKQESVKKAKLDQPNELPKDGSFMEMFLKKQAELEKANADATREGSIIQDTIMTPEDAALGSKADAIAAAASAAPVAQSTDANAGSTMETAAATVSVSAVQNK